MRCVVITRYSLLTEPGRNRFKIAKGAPVGRYREQLFSPARLAAHEYLFENLTLPSIVGQTRKPSRDWLRWLLLVSPELPSPNRARLSAAIAPYPWIEIRQRGPEEPYDFSPLAETAARTIDGPGDLYVTARLDDDDGLSRDFFERLSAYAIPENAGAVVSLASGYAIEFDTARKCFGDCYTYEVPMLAIGLAMVHRFDGVGPRSIFGAGPHDLVEKNHRLILDTKLPATIRTMHRASDNFLAGPRDYHRNRRVPHSELLRYFSVAPEVFAAETNRRES